MAQTAWYYAVDGQQLGPVSSTELKQLAIVGRLQPTDLVWREGMKDWQEARTIPGLFAPGAGEAPVANLPPPPPGVRAPEAYREEPIPIAQPYYGYPQPPQPMPPTESHNGMAIAGFVCSLVIPLLGLIFSAIALAGMKRTGNSEGKGLAIAGLVISLVWVSLVVFMLIVWGSVFSCCVFSNLR